jgi:hypothetical protein
MWVRAVAQPLRQWPRNAVRGMVWPKAIGTRIQRAPLQGRASVPLL